MCSTANGARRVSYNTKIVTIGRSASPGPRNRGGRRLEVRWRRSIRNTRKTRRRTRKTRNRRIRKSPTEFDTDPLNGSASLTLTQTESPTNQPTTLKKSAGPESKFLHIITTPPPRTSPTYSYHPRLELGPHANAPIEQEGEQHGIQHDDTYDGTVQRLPVLHELLPQQHANRHGRDQHHRQHFEPDADPTVSAGKELYLCLRRGTCASPQYRATN